LVAAIPEKVEEQSRAADLGPRRRRPLVPSLAVGEQPDKRARRIVSEPLFSVDHHHPRQDQRHESGGHQEEARA
jgi:hypothetical protein